MQHMVTDLKLKLVSISLSLWKFFYCLECKTLGKKILQQSIEKKIRDLKAEREFGFTFQLTRAHRKYLYFCLGYSGFTG